MKKRTSIIVALIIIAVAYAVFSIISYAGSSTLYIGINATHSNGVGYGIGDPKNAGMEIWNLRNYDSTDRADESANQIDIYCLKAEYGQGWESDIDNIVEYNLTYDLQNDREKLLQLLVDSGTNTANDVVSGILDAENGYYKELLWVLDNAYISGKSDLTNLLERIGIKYDTEYDVYYYEPSSDYDYSEKITNIEYNYTLTETDVKAVQQAVIWYFMNAMLDGNTTLDRTDTSSWLTITTDGTTYTNLSDLTKFTSSEGQDREDQANILYNYLIDSATNNASNYNEGNGYIIQAPVEFDSTGLSTNESGQYEIGISKNGTNYIIGPIKINRNNELDYNLELRLTNENGQEISSSNYRFTNSVGTSLGVTDLKDLVGQAEGFYITISRQTAKEVGIDINMSYKTNTKQIWLSGIENGTTSITLNAEQPTVEVDVDEQAHTQSVSLTAIPDEFDLALRKYITQVNGVAVEDSRVPYISTDTLQTGTTATYNHRKDPVLVQKGDIVTYKITIYNEGNKNGYATEIVDQLPTGLKYTGGSVVTSNKNTYNVTYNETSNNVTFTANTNTALNKYATNSLDSETLEFTCEVTATPDTSNDKILTNVAWISGAYDSDDGKTITNVGDDIDSRPQTTPTVDKDSMENYKGNSNNKTDLTDSNYFYEGEQDDDDFEKLLIEPETTVTVTKTWEDNDNQDGIRPTSITVNLLADGVAVEGKTATLSEGNNWTYTFDSLPLKANGTSITYGVSETSDVTGYDASINGFTITNTHVPETTEISVEKKWEDNNDQDGIRPTSVTVKLLADGTETGKSIDLKDTNSWKYTFTDLPVYSDGVKITYTISESIVPEGYTAEITGDAQNGFVVTNTHIPGTVSVSVNKVWNDKNDQDKIRPTEVTVRLLANGTVVAGKEVTLNTTNNWTYTFTDLQEKENGTAINYEVEEVDVQNGYSAKVEGNMIQGYTITNTHKIFDLALRKYITAVNGTNVTNTRVPSISESTLETGTTATYNHKKDPVKVSENDIVTYKIAVYNEGEKTGYASQIVDQLPTGLVYVPNSTVISKDSSGSNKNTYTVTYEPISNKITFDIENTIENPAQELQPYEKNNIDVEIIEIQCKVVAQADTSNSKTLTNIAWIASAYDTEDDKVAKDRDSEPETVPNANKDSMEHYKGNTGNKDDLTDKTYYYEGEQDDDDFEKLVLEPEISITVTKTWEDNENQDGARPNSITVSLLADGVAVTGKTAILNGENSWTHTFAGLPRKENGVDINYTVSEPTVPTGYSTETTGTMETGFTITNTYVPETLNIPVIKVWEDNENQDGIRPTEVTVSLLANGTAVDGKTITLNATNNWTYTYRNLPKKENGTNINYTLAEVTVPTGYSSETTGNMTNGFTITNTHIPETTEISVEKKWEDSNNQDGKRPTQITVTLYANGEEAEGKAVTLSSTNSWKYTFTNLAKKDSGIDINYTVVETGIPTGYTSETTGNMTDGFIITNTYIPETRDISVKKVWEDNDNQDGLRPTSIELILKADGTESQRITLTGEGNEWSYTFNRVPKYSNGTEIDYTVQENGVPEGYTSLTSGSMLVGFTITNTYTPGKTSVKVKKVWEDNNNQDGLRPDSVSVSLLADDVVVEGKTIDLNEANGWTYIFTDLPIKKDGVDIKYTIKENTTIEGYTTIITNDNVTSTSGEIQTTSAPEYTIINTHETDTINITVNKVWDDENNKDGTRPTSVVVNIKNGDTIVRTETLSNDNNWEYTFEDLPTKSDGIDINYVLEEIEPEGYTADITENSANNYTIKNTHVPNKIFDLALRKYIIKINNNKLTDLGLVTRAPNISESTLQTGKTASYRHKKDPVEVETNDIITYAITIYNEGEKAGYASQIIDQLPTGLIYNPSSTIVSKDMTGADKNTYTVTYDTTTNKVTFDIVNTTEEPAQELQPYATGNLDYETLEIKCKVIKEAEAGKKNILTNVAWISGAYDTEENKVAIDRDSQPETKPNVNKDNMEDYKGNSGNKTDLTDNNNFYEGEQDDDDFEKLYVKTFDLSLRKFVSQVNDKKLDREPEVDVTPLVNKTDTTAIYKHSKIPVSLKVGDTVIYTIRAYNEGEIDGYANEVKDYLPPYLEYVENSTINNKYGWSISEDGRIATTTYLSTKEISAFDGTELDYEDIQIECKVSTEAEPKQNITNIAEISEYKYGDTVVPKDIDSSSNNIDENLPEDKDLPYYKKEELDKTYVPGNEDDDDFEKVYVKEFDLALRKFITEIQGKEVTSRVPEVKYENGQIRYEHSKDAITVHVGDTVIYTIRIYNEGEIDGYASEITDDIPEYLEYLPEESTNVDYMWKMYDENGEETQELEEAVKVKTEYLSKDNSTNNLIQAFDGNMLYYKDIKIAFKVKDPNSNTIIITNHAQISDDTDENGNPIKDKDSETDKWNEGEDDQDIENVKVEYFDLSLLKFVSKVIVVEDGKETITETGYNGHEDPEPVVKVELHRKKLNQVTVKFGYGITITNEGDIPGYATEITDYVPEGLKFEASDNPNWTDEGNNVISTKQLENTLLQPGESKTIEVILTWINGNDNLALKTNTAEISEDNNEYDVPDRDSTPDNKKEGEDDIDIAKVILSVATGSGKTYFTLTLGLLTIVLLGVAAIKKFVI